MIEEISFFPGLLQPGDVVILAGGDHYTVIPGLRLRLDTRSKKQKRKDRALARKRERDSHERPDNLHRN